MCAHDTIETTAERIQESTIDVSRKSKGCCMLEGIEGVALGVRFDILNKALVGRDAECDLRIEDQTVSRKHMRVLCKGKKVTVLSLQDANPVLVNGRAVKEAEISDGDALTLGQSVLRAHLAADVGPSKTKKGGKPVNKVRLALYGLLLVFALGIIAVAVMPKGEQAPPEESVLEQEKAKQRQIMSANLKREIAVHLSNGKKYFEQKDYTQAAGRFARVLELNPDNAEAKDYAQRIEAIQRQQREQELVAQQRAMELREKLSPLLSQANVFIGTKHYDQAHEVLLKAKEIAPEDADVVKLLQEVETALEEQRKQEALQAKLQERQEGKVQRTLAKAGQYEKDKQYYRALKEYQYLLSMNIPGPETEAAKKAVASLEKKLRGITAAEYKKGLELLKDEKPGEALQAWEEVLAVYPDHKDAQAQINRLLPAIAERGKQLYRDGLVLEDLGQTERAVEKWREAVETLTSLGQDEYLVKAKKKLDQYRSVQVD